MAPSHYTFGKPFRGPTGASDHMTVELCAAVCSGFEYFGLEYARECNCGHEIELGHYYDRYGDLVCDMACPGDVSQTCGGSDWTTVYKQDDAVPLPAAPSYSYTSEGCHTEGLYSRALFGGSFYSDNMTVEYDLFGLEYFRECYCGDVLNVGSDPAPASICNFPCAGGVGTCGSNNRLNVYSYGTPAPTTSSTTSTFIPNPTD